LSLIRSTFLHSLWWLLCFSDNFRLHVHL